MAEVKTFIALARLIESEHRAEIERTKLERIERKRERQDQAVIGGVYHPEPVDRAAAMLLARSPWWAFAPDVRQNKHEIKQEEKKMTEKAVHLCDKNRDQSLMPATKGEPLYDIDELAVRICDKIEKQIPKELRSLAECAVNARGMLDESIKGIGHNMEEFERVTKSANQNVRAQRMSIVTECSNIVNALKDIRQFFLGPDYEREQKRLADFVDLCERLNRLKESGFLDTVADTMIRLSSSEKL